MKSNILKSLPFLALCCPIPATANTPSLQDHVIVDGKCSPTSGVTIDDDPLSRLYCDVAIISRTERGAILIQFSDKQGDDGRILGFAGTMEGRQGFGADPVQAIAVERVYLGGGVQPFRADKGTCFINWTGLRRTGGKVTSVMCGGRGAAEGHDVQAMVVLDAE